MFMIIPYMPESLEIFNKSLTTLIIRASSRYKFFNILDNINKYYFYRSMTPSISNKTIKDIGNMVKIFPQLTHLELEFGDPSPENRKVVKDDG